MHDQRVVALVTAFESSTGEGERVLAADPESLNLQTSLGETALHLACITNSLAAVRDLISQGAEVNTVSCCGDTPLSDAASLGYSEIVQVLLAAGAMVSAEGQQEPSLHRAVRNGTLHVVQQLVEAGADVNEQGPLDEAPLHIAAEGDLAEVAEFLLSSGANLSLRGTFDETALDVAIRSNSVLCVALLSPRH